MYELSVSQLCFCQITGAYRLRVEDQQIVDVDPLVDPFASLLGVTNLSYLPANLHDLDSLTIDATFAKAEQAIFRYWNAPWFSQIFVSYDPVDGYVAHLEHDENGWLSGWFYAISDSHYWYTAEDLHIETHPTDIGE